MNRKISNKLYIYNFFLCILVIWIHAVNLAEDNRSLRIMVSMKEITGYVEPGMERYVDALACFQNFIANVLGEMAVPGFFAVSGYLFYRNLTEFGEIPVKWKKRFQSLVVPYLFFNLIWYLFYIILGRAEWSVGNLWDAILNYHYNPVFWYVFQLILLTMLAPGILLLLKHAILAKGFTLIFLLMASFEWGIPWVNADALFYYYVGALASWYYRSIVESQNRKEVARIGAGVLVIAVLTGLLSQDMLSIVGRHLTEFALEGMDPEAASDVSWNGMRITLVNQFDLVRHVLLRQPVQLCTTVIHRISMAVAFWLLLPAPSGEVRLPSWMKETFFIYAMHYPLVRILRYMASYGGIGINHLEERWILTGLYVLTPALVISVIALIRRLLLTFAPKVYKMMSGNRN